MEWVLLISPVAGTVLRARATTSTEGNPGNLAENARSRRFAREPIAQTTDAAARETPQRCKTRWPREYGLNSET